MSTSAPTRAAAPAADDSKQPKAVWAVAFASVIAFMGIGLVDPILKPIGEQLHASPSQVSLLFTSYMLVTGVAMLITGVVSSRFGAKKTLVAGLAIIIVFAALAGMSGTVGQIVGFRAGWGLGNALFIATALATIVGAASGGVARAIILYEAALGIGIATGPLLGGLLGGISWRGPFFGVSVLMAVALVSIVVLLPEGPKPTHRTSIAAPFRALRHRGLLIVSSTALLYNFGFFTLLAYTPFPLDLGTYAIGFIFCGWGVLLAVASVFLAPPLQRRFGSLPMMGLALGLFAADLAAMAAFAGHKPVLIIGTVLAGLFLGVNNTLITEAVMASAPVERSTASAAYSFVRFAGGAAAPYLAGKLGNTASRCRSGSARRAPPPRSPSCWRGAPPSSTSTSTIPHRTASRKPRPSRSATTEPHHTQPRAWPPAPIPPVRAPVRGVRSTDMTEAKRGRVSVETSQKRVRVYLGGHLVADSARPVLVWENPHYPSYYLPVADVRAKLEPNGHTQHSTSRGDATVYDVMVDGTTAGGAALRYHDSPLTALRDLVRLEWNAMDEWFEEDEPIYVHPRDPYSRVDILASSRHVRVEIDGVTVADSRAPRILFETGLPARYYLPMTDVRMDLLHPSATHTSCPYKGTADYWTVRVAGKEYPDYVWGYRTPLPESQKVAGLVCFYNEKVDIYVDGDLQERPRSPFS